MYFIFACKFNIQKNLKLLVAVFCNINDNRFFPPEHEVAYWGTNNYRQAKPNVVRHEN